MKRRLMLMIGMLVLVGSGSFVAVFLLMSDSITQSACASIQEGMTEADVTRILGRPRDFVEHFESMEMTDEGLHELPVAFSVKTWSGDAGNISVNFNDAGIVKSAQFNDNENSVWRKVRRAFGPKEEGLTLPSPYYLHHSPKYIPASEPYTLPNDSRSLDEAAKKADDNPE